MLHLDKYDTFLIFHINIVLQIVFYGLQFQCLTNLIYKRLDEDVLFSNQLSQQDGT